MLEPESLGRIDAVNYFMYDKARVGIDTGLVCALRWN
jgi:hypothetical protein